MNLKPHLPVTVSGSRGLVPPTPGPGGVRGRLGALCGVVLLATLAAEAQSVAPNPEAAGLWIGETTLNFVSHASAGTLEATPTSAQLRLILHVDATGNVRLLKDVIVAKRSPADGFDTVLVTDPARLAALPLATDLATSRVAGQRFSTVAYDFTDDDATPTDQVLNLAGGLGGGFECQGTLRLPHDHPTNPFRHKYHPDHSNEGPKAYTITRALKLHGFGAVEEVGGVTQLRCSYEEKIAGLHLAELTVQGTTILRRVATTPVLNQ